mmetsp:Transcript_60169/g.169753  ORF Transcript_60169/g.169753 Transcript_60169/m.169753 type:complete len:235 (-) Transcript_60169:32-736(-)
MFRPERLNHVVGAQHDNDDVGLGQEGVVEFHRLPVGLSGSRRLASHQRGAAVAEAHDLELRAQHPLQLPGVAPGAVGGERPVRDAVSDASHADDLRPGGPGGPGVPSWRADTDDVLPAQGVQEVCSNARRGGVQSRSVQRYHVCRGRRGRSVQVSLRGEHRQAPHQPGCQGEVPSANPGISGEADRDPCHVVEFYLTASQTTHLSRAIFTHPHLMRDRRGTGTGGSERPTAAAI